MRMEHLIHVNFCVSDLDRSLEFYRDLLGGVVVDEATKDRSEFMENQGETGDTGYRAAFLAFGDNLRGRPVPSTCWSGTPLIQGGPSPGGASASPASPWRWTMWTGSTSGWPTRGSTYLDRRNR